ncbi:uncharacterized protein RSE6_04050 [Rhynchosporium secalis]|uniref:Uncharacterized protein n=1 Tax=Rhynchosporium secalis TaxID=38038 RepID=A0A1E1M4A6_RHYSE|nr:uncharacterized protein RSE6_04050 [Rhynchosporium secalis]
MTVFDAQSLLPLQTALSMGTPTWLMTSTRAVPLMNKPQLQIKYMSHCPSSTHKRNATPPSDTPRRGKYMSTIQSSITENLFLPIADPKPDYSTPSEV